ncbi:MAG TPA: septum formation initiator family protein [Chitinophagales bacterium]|nr:septum formation initiator family protein [Paludibacteraceae bacterium]HOU47533.1 septum formation initiator family protein [Chitinophagales bacterium]HOH71081.1 septum formation initiator family protein [Paludibacteraceae bacterium]HQC04683.1 septum formation initiator family protein [Paludibacteraceae bacterium]HRR59018.1 septum formation initiator family protein [Paludibacteraceae bacterium]
MKNSLFWKYLKYAVTNKYLIVVLVFVVYCLFFDQHNWVKRAKNRYKIAELESDINYYKEKIADDNKQMQKYSSGTEELEKMARETYFMKCPEEEVFVIK